MTSAFDQLRDQVGRQLDELLSGKLATTGERATIRLPRYFQRNGTATQQREQLWVEIQARYLARQSGVERDGRAALLTAGAPGAGKSTAVQQLGLVDDGWRRLDADIVKGRSRSGVGCGRRRRRRACRVAGRRPRGHAP